MLFAVDVAELVLALTVFELDGDVEGAAGGDGATDAREDDDGNGFKGDVLGGFGHEHEGFVEAEEVAFVGFDAAFDAALGVVAVGLS